MNDEGKITLASLLVVLLIIIIAVMGVSIVKLNNDKKELKASSTELSNKVSKLEASENTMKEKLGIISNTISDTSSNTDTANNSFSDEEIKKAIQYYLSLMGVLEGSPEEMLVEIGLIDQNKYAYTQAGSDNFIKTDVRYEVFKNRMLECITEEFFNQNEALKLKFKNQDGYLAFKHVGATGIGYTVKEITIKGDSSDSSYIAKVENEFGEEENVEFHIADSNGKCVISYCD